MSPKEQGKQKGKPARAPAPPDRAAARRRLGLLAFGVLLVGLFVGVALAQGFGDPEVPDDAIAIVEEAPNEEITVEEFERSLTQTAARQGLPEVPPDDDPQFDLLRDGAISDLILSRWVLGEAEDRGIEITDREIAEELERVKEEQFGSDKAFDKFLEDSGFTLEEARERIRLQLVSDRIQRAVLPEDPGITDEEIETYYNENQEQFEQPETRDVRVILTRNEEEADEALAALEEDSTPKGFEEVAKEFSIDEATKSTGGLRDAVVEGQSEPALDEQIFSAPQGELVGPFETESGFYVIQVETINPAQTVPLDEAREQVEQTLIAARQQEIATAFQDRFTSKWQVRTFCAEDYRIDRCSNPPSVPDACTEEIATTTGCGAPVASTRPIAPGSAGVFGTPTAPALPQGPFTGETAASDLPPGLIPGGGVPPGAAPPGAAPPGTAPPGTAPPGG